MRASYSRIEHRICFDLANDTCHLKKNEGGWTQERDEFHAPRDVDVDGAVDLVSPQRAEFNSDDIIVLL
jgi:hypothetical protein